MKYFPNLSLDGFPSLYYQNIIFPDSEAALSFWTTQVKQTMQPIILFCALPRTITAGLEILADKIKHDIENDTELSMIVRVRRGGRLSVYGPGQLIVYPIAPIGFWGITPQLWVTILEKTIRLWLRSLGLRSQFRKSLTGVWFLHNQQFYKLASLGIGVKQGITQYGFSINISTENSLFAGFVSCGNRQDKMISVQEIWSTYLNKTLSSFPTNYETMLLLKRILMKILQKNLKNFNKIKTLNGILV